MKKETIILAGGCFWCTEAVFKSLGGVISVVSGYAGGNKDNPTYEEVSSGLTGHAESVKIEYDSNVRPLMDLLTVFFATHDPTTKNRQGADVGTQYRSAIFYSNDEQKKIIESFIRDINLSDFNGKNIATEILPFSNFYSAENYHQDYYANHKNDSYCEIVINPKLQKVVEKFAMMLKDK